VPFVTIQFLPFLHHLISVHSTSYHSHSILTSQRTRMYHSCNIFILLLILLSGDIQFNPEPVSRVSSLNMCTLNIRCFTNPVHYTAIADLADTHNIDVFALTETWISPNTTSAQLFDAIPRGLTFIKI